ncbi:MAG: glycosyltransferase [Clostridiales bacterium]|nr:glycosyltransferase [Clostridiales bacterium]
MSVREIRRVSKDFDVDIIHAHDFRASVLAASSFKGRIVSHIHHNPSWIRKYGLNSITYLLATARFSTVVGVSHSVFDEYVFGDLLRQKSMVMGNQVDISYIRRQSERQAEETRDDGPFDIVFLGRLSQPKNPRRFLDIVEKVKRMKPDLRVIMIGDGELRAEIGAEVEKLGLRENILMTGFLDNPYPLVSKSKVLCMTSRWEGFGLAAVEGLSLGLPVVCTDCGGLRQIVDEMCGKTCRTDSEFVYEILKLLDDHEYYEEKSRQAELRSYEFDNISAYREQLEKIYLGDSWV